MTRLGVPRPPLLAWLAEDYTWTVLEPREGADCDDLRHNTFAFRSCRLRHCAYLTFGIACERPGTTAAPMPVSLYLPPDIPVHPLPLRRRRHFGATRGHTRCAAPTIRAFALNFRVVPWWCCSRPWQLHRRTSRCNRLTWSSVFLHVPHCGTAVSV